MSKKIDPERFKSFDVMLPQGARSRFQKAVKAVNDADDLIPDDALTGTAAELREAIKHLGSAIENLAELMAYRKMMGID